MIDLATVVFRDELPVLKLQAQSVELYCQEIGIKNIYVVVNDTPDLVKEIDPAWWGTLADRVTVLHRSVFSTEFVNNGWVSQQILKILAASVSYNTWTMVLDAKTIFVSPIEKLFDSKGRACVGTDLDIFPVFEKSKQIANDLYRVNLTRQIGPGGVPYLFHNDTVRNMIVDTANLTHHSFPGWFQQQGMLTEFILYSGYILYRYGSFSGLYADNNSLTVCNVCHSETGIFDQKFKQMQQNGVSAVSVHRHAWSVLSDIQQKQYRDFLINRGITQAEHL